MLKDSEKNMSFMAFKAVEKEEGEGRGKRKGSEVKGKRKEERKDRKKMNEDWVKN